MVSFNLPWLGSYWGCLVVKAGKLRALLVTGKRRVPQLPDVPTAAEAGVPGLEVYSWGGLIGPPGMPRPIVQRLNAEFTRILQSPEIRNKREFADSDIVASTPEEFAAFIKREQSRWAERVRSIGLKPE